MYEPNQKTCHLIKIHISITKMLFDSLILSRYKFNKRSTD